MADINSALQKARAMIKKDAKADAHILKERAMDRNNPKYFRGQPNDEFSGPVSLRALNEMDSSSADNNFSSALDEMTTSMMNIQTQSVPQTFQSAPSVSAASKLPKAILESLSNDYIDRSALDPDYSPELAHAQALMTETTKKEQVITEQPVQQTVSGIDYSLIKTIVEECVRKYAGTITKKVLAESKQTQGDELRAIKIGESFTFVTSNGDLYEAQLKFKKNLNKASKKD